VTPARIGLISHSEIANDPRVRRQGDALSSAGHDVVAVGLVGDASSPPRWPVLGIGREHSSMPEKSALRTVRRLLDMPLQALRPAHAWSVYWRLNSDYRALSKLAIALDVDFWIANDWTVLPIVLDLARARGTPFGYDTHELSVEEYSQHLKWRLSMRPVIAQIERAGIRHAAFVSCVSVGIAEHLTRIYGLSQRPHVIRNAPPYESSPLRITSTPIKVLYHGGVMQGRELEEIIASVRLWRPEFHLTIRGPADPAYLAHLRHLASDAGVAGRIAFAPPVPMTELVAAARDFDVGLFVIRGHSLQNEFVLPNKFFEYAMAGLALCVSDLPEMRRLIMSHSMGVLINVVKPAAIAATINGMDLAMIDAYKVSALKAARELCWEREAKILVELVGSALTRSAQTRTVQ
jgi:glycosyltransferase involved in cell wall biosynthesis